MQELRSHQTSCKSARMGLATAALFLAGLPVSNAAGGDAEPLAAIPGTGYEIVAGESQLSGSGTPKPRLVDAITKWISQEFELASPAEVPEVERVSHDAMIAIRYGVSEGTPDAIAGAAYDEGLGVVALYDDRNKRIYLSDRWSGGSPSEVSVLVHELVHHFQNLSGVSHACPAAREKLAYDAQGKFLSLFGETLESAFSIDPLTLLVRTSCLM